MGDGSNTVPDVPENKGTLRQTIPVDSSLLMNPPGKKPRFCFFLRELSVLCER